jgi:hypothetical protein
VLFFIEVANRRVSLGGITRHPDSWCMQQVARNATMQDIGYLNGCRYLLHDRDKKFCREFRETLAVGGVECTPIPARSPNLNAHAERWVRSIKEECLSKADPVRGEVVAACGVELPGTLSPRTKPSRQGQSFAVPRVCAGAEFAWCNLLSRAARRLTQILQSRRMSILTKVGPQVRADQMGHGVDVNQNDYTKASLERRKEAVNALERAVGLNLM